MFDITTDGREIVIQRGIVRNLQQASEDFLALYAISKRYATLRDARSTVSKLELAKAKLARMEAD